jgi:hypothetical protein
MLGSGASGPDPMALALPGLVMAGPAKARFHVAVTVTDVFMLNDYP